MTAFVMIKIKLQTMRIKGMFNERHFKGANTYCTTLPRRNINYSTHKEETPHPFGNKQSHYIMKAS
jgi:hypothetical protein